jgi:hypothetical protein
MRLGRYGDDEASQHGSPHRIRDGIGPVVKVRGREQLFFIVKIELSTIAKNEFDYSTYFV